jgi:hypothetical protein
MDASDMGIAAQRIFDGLGAAQTGEVRRKRLVSRFTGATRPGMVA